MDYTISPSVLPLDRGVRHKIDFIVSHDSGLCQRNSVKSLTNSSMLSTRRKWYEKVNLPIRHRHFVSKSLMVNGASSMLIISSMLPLYQHKPPFLERMPARLTFWIKQMQMAIASALFLTEPQKVAMAIS